MRLPQVSHTTRKMALKKSKMSPEKNSCAAETGKEGSYLIKKKLNKNKIKKKLSKSSYSFISFHFRTSRFFLLLFLK